jgi:hypothetical protein
METKREVAEQSASPGEPLTTEASSWLLQWEFGRAEVQALGAMLGPVVFRLDTSRELQVMHVAPWASDARAAALPGLLQRLRGEWPCLPFGRTDAPADLPATWQVFAADDEWSHGYGSNHLWTCEHADAGQVVLSIAYPYTSPIERIERRVQVVPDAAALDISLVVHARRSAVLPAGLHPTFRLPPSTGRVQIELAAHEGVFSYPSRSAGSITRLLPDRRGESLADMPGMAGPLDLSRLPLEEAGEELMQVRGLRADGDEAALRLHYLDEDASVGLWWDTARLPDLMLWVSNRGRPDYPWQGQHVALGAEPVSSVFDLSRVARPPQGHPLADRRGIQISPELPWSTRYRIAARSALRALNA